VETTIAKFCADDEVNNAMKQWANIQKRIFYSYGFTKLVNC
jgi:hypothetical protein